MRRQRQDGWLCSQQEGPANVRMPKRIHKGEKGWGWRMPQASIACDKRVVECTADLSICALLAIVPCRVNFISHFSVADSLRLYINPVFLSVPFCASCDDQKETAYKQARMCTDIVCMYHCTCVATNVHRLHVVTSFVRRYIICTRLHHLHAVTVVVTAPPNLRALLS